jgi:hypothetical protein
MGDIGRKIRKVELVPEKELKPAGAPAEPAAPAREPEPAPA